MRGSCAVDSSPRAPLWRSRAMHPHRCFSCSGRVSSRLCEGGVCGSASGRNRFAILGRRKGEADAAGGDQLGSECGHAALLVHSQAT
eukprot:6186027-Pleurochrysis_carterae.AAC.2